MAVRTQKLLSCKVRRFGSRAAIAEEADEVKHDTGRIHAWLRSPNLSTGLRKALHEIINLDILCIMSGDGIDRAITRIEAALARISAAANALPNARADFGHKGDSALRQEVLGALQQLDTLIESMEK